MKITQKTMRLLTRELKNNGSVDCLLLFHHPLNEYQRKMLAASGCEYLSVLTGRSVWVRVRPGEIHTITNLGFIAEIDVHVSA